MFHKQRYLFKYMLMISEVNFRNVKTQFVCPLEVKFIPGLSFLAIDFFFVPSYFHLPLSPDLISARISTIYVRLFFQFHDLFRYVLFCYFRPLSFVSWSLFCYCLFHVQSTIMIKYCNLSSGHRGIISEKSLCEMGGQL